MPVLQSWEPLVQGARCRGKPVQKKITAMVLLTCVSQRGELRGRKRRRL